MRNCTALIYMFFLLVSLGLSGCTSTGPTQLSQTKPIFQLADRAQFLQTDKRWARQTLGGSYEALSSDGCLVTAAAMALVNLGFRTDPGDLTNRLKSLDGFTKNGWLVWSGVERATGGRAKTLFYNRKDDDTVRACLAADYYPLVKFDLPGGRTHWALVIGESQSGFFVRDPIVNSKRPIALSSRTDKIDAIRCIGVEA